MKYVTEQMEKVQAIGNEKNKIREAVMDVMESKLQAQFAQKAAQGQAPAVAKWLREEKISWNQFLRKFFFAGFEKYAKIWKKVQFEKVLVLLCLPQRVKLLGFFKLFPNGGASEWDCGVE